MSACAFSPALRASPTLIQSLRIEKDVSGILKGAALGQGMWVLVLQNPLSAREKLKLRGELEQSLMDSRDRFGVAPLNYRYFTTQPGSAAAEFATEVLDPLVSELKLHQSSLPAPNVSDYFVIDLSDAPFADLPNWEKLFQQMNGYRSYALKSKVLIVLPETYLTEFHSWIDLSSCVKFYGNYR